MKENYPLISCLCVTREKPQLLERAYTCFREQTYNNKELVIVFEDDDELTSNWIKQLDDGNVRTFMIEKSPETNLGELRNIAVINARGEYICQWDDDDWYHIGRLEYQYEVIRESGLPGCIMSRWIIFDSTTRKAYISNRRLWEGSILCKKSFMTEKEYKNQKKGEDTAVIDHLVSQKLLAFIGNVPNLYIYIYHGKNTWDYNHWKNFFELSEELSPANSEKINDILNGNLLITKGSLILDDILNNPIFEEYE